MAKKKASRNANADRRVGNGKTSKAVGSHSALDDLDQRARGRAGFSGFGLGVEDVVALLGTDQRREEIDAVVGENYADYLRGLAQEANRVRNRSAQRVLILPGILGSTLAVGNDTIWFDPLDIVRGKLSLLSLDGGSNNVVSNGVFWPTYVELQLKLWIAGYRTEYFHFDWRKSIREAGKKLCDYVRSIATARQKVSLVAHSIGGLVSRAALKLLGSDADNLISQTVLLGTPNQGSFAPALVFANDYSTVQWIERFDLVNQQDTLTRDVFSTFLGLAEMLPAPSQIGSMDLFKANAYPPQQRSVRQSVLTKAAGLQDHLAPGSSKIWMIVGVQQDTVTKVEVAGANSAKFQTTTTKAGDGTVPTALAKLDGANNRYVIAGHSKLPAHNEVIRCVVDILNTGTTTRLATTPQAARRSGTRSEVSLSTETLSRVVIEQRRGLELTDREIRGMLEPLLTTESDVETIGMPTSEVPRLTDEPLIISRKRQNRIDLRLIHGDVAQVQGRALMLGLFKQIRPSGAAAAVDEHLGGALAEVIDRRMFSANMGEIFVLPTPRYGLNVEMVVLIGLGDFSQFTPQSLKSSVENAARTLLRSRVDDLVTVPMGGGSGLAMDQIVGAIIDGVQSALADVPGRHSLRSLGIAAKDSQEYDRMIEQVLTLTTSARFDGLEFTIERETLPELIVQRVATDTDSAGGTLAIRTASTYVYLREVSEPAEDGLNAQTTIGVSLLGSTGKAVVLAHDLEVDNTKLEQFLVDAERA